MCLVIVLKGVSEPLSPHPGTHPFPWRDNVELEGIFRTIKSVVVNGTLGAQGLQTCFRGPSWEGRLGIKLQESPNLKRFSFNLFYMSGIHLIL